MLTNSQQENQSSDNVADGDVSDACWRASTHCACLPPAALHATAPLPTHTKCNNPPLRRPGLSSTVYPRHPWCTAVPGSTDPSPLQAPAKLELHDMPAAACSKAPGYVQLSSKWLYNTSPTTTTGWKTQLLPVGSGFSIPSWLAVTPDLAACGSAAQLRLSEEDAVSLLNSGGCEVEADRGDLFLLLLLLLTLLSW
jgi:hypothetical protein